MQLVAYGAQDVFLTGTPEITFWKVSYRRHTNFAMESIEQTFSGQADFGRRVTCTISRNGDLAYRTYLQVTLPEINQSQKTSGTDGVYARWLDFVGEQLVSQVEVEIVVKELTVNTVTGCTSGTNLPFHLNNNVDTSR